MAHVDFWHEFASTYSYPAAMRVEAEAAKRGVGVRWRPFLLGPIFVEAGWRDSPFNIFPVKGRYMWRDMERLCAALSLPLTRPDPFPQNSLLAARIELALPEPDRAAFARAVYSAEFGEGRDISDRAALAACLSTAAIEPQGAIERAETPENKAALKHAGETAKALGLPGAPCFVTAGGEVFWGNDRLEAALDWAARE